MSDYTVEDFARANLATRGEYMVARRCGEDRTPWAIFLHNRPVLYVTDANMVLHNWTPVVESRITLDGLAAAYEAAEQADECREGDVLISTSWKGAGDFRVYSARSAKDLPPGLRILFRAPKREPWQDLADVLLSESVIFDSEDANIAARALHNAGVRMTGGEES